MDATLRIAYKFNRSLGRFYSLIKELFNKKQIYKGFRKKYSGHLIIRGFK